MSTTLVKPAEVERKWYLLDASGKSLGHVAAEAAVLLRGKQKVNYTPNVDCGDYVVVINCDKAVLTGKKAEQKFHITHSKFIGGLKKIQYSKLMAENSDLAMTYAVKGKGGTLKTSEESGADSIKFEDGDELLQVTAVPDKGYKFDRWSDGYTRAERTDKPGEKTGTLYAIFVEDSASEEVTYTLFYHVSGEGGVLVVDDGSRKSGISYTVSENDDPITIKADADHGYHFVEWSDGVTDATRTDNDGESMHDVDVSAIFEKDADSDSTPSSKPKKVDPTPSPSPSPSPSPYSSACLTSTRSA